ncbi:restriction endonuclease [Mesobacillus jeotgali]|uniref:restriction endonuclease n=1 Tax=Mesobacillus jeotgali TaxID=129985 RepID=UPI0015D5F026|nr:restriction endonuclease [Mesobacillus jeotgali]
MRDYQRSVDELQAVAANWWPQNLVSLESESSIIPLLVRTQDDFISILKLCGKSVHNPLKVFDLIQASDFPANLFLKHLIVLADFGGEKLQRLNKSFDGLFPKDQENGKYYLDFYMNETEHTYFFQNLPIQSLGNKHLKIDGKGLQHEVELNDLTKDVIMLLLYGSNAVLEKISHVLNKCVIGNLIGLPSELEKFIKQRYIFVSRITGGAEANTLGQVAQQYVMEYLRTRLPGYGIRSNGHIPGVTHNDGRTETTFDIVVSYNGRHVAIEISFQVTTNSTIERKAGQAKNRYDMVTESGNFIAYIIDGAGNFQRKSAISTICENSQCTVAYTDSELNVLIEFIKAKLP